MKGSIKWALALWWFIRSMADRLCYEVIVILSSDAQWCDRHQLIYRGYRQEQSAVKEVDVPMIAGAQEWQVGGKVAESSA